MGLIASHDLPVSSLIMAEVPILSIAVPTASDESEANIALMEKIMFDVRQLNKDNLNYVRQLVARVDPASRGDSLESFTQALQSPSGTFATALIDAILNATYPLSTIAKSRAHRLYRGLSFVNHSCVPNAELQWRADKQLFILGSTRPIRAGEEITVSYIDRFQQMGERHRDLGFRCMCRECVSHRRRC
jgi:hypothetical protein